MIDDAVGMTERQGNTAVDTQWQYRISCAIRQKCPLHFDVLTHVLCTIQEELLINDNMIIYLCSTCVDKES